MTKNCQLYLILSSIGSILNLGMLYSLHKKKNPIMEERKENLRSIRYEQFGSLKLEWK